MQRVLYRADGRQDRGSGKMTKGIPWTGIVIAQAADISLSCLWERVADIRRVLRQ